MGTGALARPSGAQLRLASSTSAFSLYRLSIQNEQEFRASRAYSPEAPGPGCKLESREIVATIIPERNCMVATSLLSNAWGVDDSTSKTPSVRRK